MLSSAVMLYLIFPEWCRYRVTYTFWNIRAANQREQEEKQASVPAKLLEEAARAGAAAALSASHLGKGPFNTAQASAGA